MNVWQDLPNKKKENPIFFPIQYDNKNSNNSVIILFSSN